MLASKKFKVMASLISGFALILVAVSGHRIYLVEIQKKPLKNSSKLIEANFFNFDMKSFGIAPRNQRIISATKQISKNRTLVFTSNRESAILEEFIYTPTSGIIGAALNLTSNLNIESLPIISKKHINNYFIFDLLIDGDFLLVSLVTIPNVEKSCDIFQVIKIPITDTNLVPNDSTQVWKSNVCIHTYPNDPGWHDFQGRLAVSKDNIYMSAGLLIASTYLGFYPNPNVNGLNQDLGTELEKDQLFGGVIKINKTTGRSSRIAQGFRGPSGIAVKETSLGEQIWVVDHGPRGGDELNLVIQGKNYGWPWVSYGRKYFDAAKGQVGIINTKFGTHAGYEEPIYYWTPSIAPSQLIVLPKTIDDYNSWSAGDILVSSLKANSIFRLKLDANLKIRSIEQVNIGTRIRDISVENKTIFISTDDGRIVVLEKSEMPASLGAFPAVYPIEEPFYYAIPGLRQFSNFIDSTIARISKLN